MDINSINPRILEYYQQMMFPGSVPDLTTEPQIASGESQSVLMNFLKSLSPISIKQTPESTVIGPSPSAQALQEGIEKTLFAPVRASQYVKGSIEDFLSRLSLTPEGISISKTGKTKPSTAVFNVDEGNEPISPAPVSKATRQTPSIPESGQQVGGPQYSTIPKLETPEFVPIPEEVTPPTVVPPPAEIPTEEDIAAGITPWKPKTDFMESLKQIMDEVIPKWEDLPKPEYKKPGNMLEWLGEAGRLLALKRSAGKEPYDVIRTEEADIEAKATQKRNFIVQRAAQVANLKLLGLQQTIQKEEADRERQAKFLEVAAKSKPELMNSLPFIKAVASNLGVPSEEAAKIIRQGYDPTTGQLKLYQTPEERMETQQKALWNIAEQGLVDTGMPRDRARFISRGGSKEYLDYMGTQLQSTMSQTPPDIARAKAITKNIQAYQAMTNVNTAQAKALALIERDPGLKSFDKIFTDKDTANFFKNDTMRTALGLETKTPTPHAPVEVKVAEKIKQEAKAAVGNPIKEKIFSDKYKHSPLEILFTDDATAANLPEPFSTSAKMAPPNVAKTYDTLKAWTDDPAVRSSIDTVILHKNKPVFDSVNTFLQSKKQPFLTQDERYRIATASNSGNPELVWQTVAEILTQRKVPLPIIK